MIHHADIELLEKLLLRQVELLEDIAVTVKKIERNTPALEDRE